jgi:hypothetical protein
MKSYSLLFNQNEVEFSATITTETPNISEIAGTLVNKVKKFVGLVHKHKLKTGFCFSRKFTVSLVVDGKVLTQFENIFINGQKMEFKITLQNKETSLLKFTDFIGDLCFDLLTTLGEDEVLTLDEVRAELN